MRKILIVNLMPNKIETEQHLEFMLDAEIKGLEITYLYPKTHHSESTEWYYAVSNYSCFEDIKESYFDGMMVTGAPVELLNFEEVDYWKELQEIFHWSKLHVTSSYFICWAAQAALYHFYNIPKFKLPKKRFGVFEHSNLMPNNPLMKGIPKTFHVPHSRHTEVKKEDIVQVKDLNILGLSAEAGPHLISNSNGSQIFATGHSEYPTNRLKLEYFRDKEKGLDILPPKHYFPQDDITIEPTNNWTSSGKKIFSNWLDLMR